MALNLNTIKGTPRAVGDRTLVTDMFFGEQKTAGGLIIKDDDGTTRGIYPRWAKVYSKGPQNKEVFEVGHWILVEHGRWTRAMTINTPEGEIEVRMVETDSIFGYRLFFLHTFGCCIIVFEKIFFLTNNPSTCT